MTFSNTDFYKAYTRDPGMIRPPMDTTYTYLSTLQSNQHSYQMYLAWEDLAVQKHTYMSNFSMKSITSCFNNLI